jgi:lysophospholipase L1-like esterase
MTAPDDTRVVVAFGDSITDGTASTMNGDDRWPDVLLQRLQAQGRARHVAVVNAGIGGNQVVGPEKYTPQTPFPGGPSALDRLDRDVLSLSGVTAVIWLEGINDFSKSGNATADAVIAGMKQAVARMRNRLPGVRIIGATVTTALGSTGAGHGSPAEDTERKKLNDFIRNGEVFDGVADFDKATLDPATGEMRAEFVPESTTGGPGEKLHPNRAGYEAMAATIDLAPLLAGTKAKK